jgi:hypothetical protein
MPDTLPPALAARGLATEVLRATTIRLAHSDTPSIRTRETGASANVIAVGIGQVYAPAASDQVCYPSSPSRATTSVLAPRLSVPTVPVRPARSGERSLRSNAHWPAGKRCSAARGSRLSQRRAAQAKAVNFTLLRRDAPAPAPGTWVVRDSTFRAERALKILELHAENGSIGRSPCGREVCIPARRLDPMPQR